MVAARGGTYIGDVKVSEAGVRVGETNVAWGDVLYVTTGQPPRVAVGAQAVRFKSGDVWYVEVPAISEGQVTLGEGLLGKRKVNLDGVAGVDFGAGVAGTAAVKDNTLYRDKGEPLPGKLLWADAKRVAIDSPLGVLTPARGGPMRYVVSAERAGAPKEDQVVLTDGSVLRGRVVPGRDGNFEIEHPVLGKYALAAGNVASVARHQAWATFLTETAMSVRTTPLLTRALPAETVEAANIEGPTGGRCLAAVVIPAGSRIEYPLGARAAGGSVFRATLESAESSKGTMSLRVSVGGKEVLREEFAPGGPARAIAVEMPDGDALAIEVDYGSVLAFPCGMVVADPVIVSR